MVKRIKRVKRIKNRLSARVFTTPPLKRCSPTKIAQLWRLFAYVGESSSLTTKSYSTAESSVLLPLLFLHDSTKISLHPLLTRPNPSVGLTGLGS